MRTMRESVAGFEIPESYDLYSSSFREALDIINNARNSGDGIFELVSIVYAYGFKRGMSYQKRKEKKKKRE